jgi:hypothetical protein
MRVPVNDKISLILAMLGHRSIGRAHCATDDPYSMHTPRGRWGRPGLSSAKGGRSGWAITPPSACPSDDGTPVSSPPRGARIAASSPRSGSRPSGRPFFHHLAGFAVINAERRRGRASKSSRDFQGSRWREAVLAGTSQQFPPGNDGRPREKRLVKAPVRICAGNSTEVDDGQNIALLGPTM